MLYIKEANGRYKQAPENIIFSEANSICNVRLSTRRQVRSSAEATEAVAWRLRHYKVEVFACLFLCSNLQVIAYEEICSGTINMNFVHPREIVKAAFRHNAAAVIFAHNHPSGNSKPSQQDIELTQKLVDLLEPLRISVLDHLVVGSEITSFADEGLLK